MICEKLKKIHTSMKLKKLSIKKKYHKLMYLLVATSIRKMLKYSALLNLIISGHVFRNKESSESKLDMEIFFQHTL